MNMRMGVYKLGMLRLYRGMCGVFGILSYEGNASAVAAWGTQALQHRGQESCGIVSNQRYGRDGDLTLEFSVERHPGLVGHSFQKKTGIIQGMPGNIAIGHTRYSTAGGSVIENIQPLYANHIDGIGEVAIAHNGNLTNSIALHRQLSARGSLFQSLSDTEVILHLLARSRDGDTVDRFVDALRQIEGAYALVMMTGSQLIAARDPMGIRPLLMGRQGNGSYVLASESCALYAVGATHEVREIEPGEVVVIDHEKGLHPKKYSSPARNRARPCMMETIYFSRPDSETFGKSVYEIRKTIGEQLAREAPVEADTIIPIPDSGVPAAIGFAKASGIDFDMGIVRNHFHGRSFIAPNQDQREDTVDLKNSVNPAFLKGKRVVLIDDSVVRGTTSLNVVRRVRAAGATEVHMRVASPPYIAPDFYGIDTPSKKKLIASTMSLEDMKDYLCVDSLAFASLDSIYKAAGFDGRDNAYPQFSDHAFTGEYPTDLTDLRLEEAASTAEQAHIWGKEDTSRER